MIPVELVVGGNEASDLVPIRASEVLDAYGWRAGFWTVLDEGPVEQSIALLGSRSADPGRWDAHLLAAEAGAETGRTEDAEALAYRDGHVYVIGSHFGSKRGPLRPRRAFVARFREADAALPHAVHLEVARNQFRLHRAVNDALRDVPLLTGAVARSRFIDGTRDRGTAKAKTWVDRIRSGDAPINVEAAAFTPAGSLLLGLRYPLSAEGGPLLVELSDVEALFDGRPLDVRAVHVLPSTEVPYGFRALSPRPDGSYDAVLGSVDALGKDSAVLEDHPGAGEVTCRHVRFSLPAVAPELVADLSQFHNVEGVSTVEDGVYYITDEDHRVVLWRS